MSRLASGFLVSGSRTATSGDGSFGIDRVRASWFRCGMSSQNRSQQIFMTLATVIAWSGFAFSHWMSDRRQAEAGPPHLLRFDDGLGSLPRELGCKGEVLMGVCTDPPCIDSDSSGTLDQSYVPGNVTSYRGMMGSHQTIEDVCINTRDLREGTCKLEGDGGAAVPEWIKIHCDKGCSNGACVR